MLETGKAGEVTQCPAHLIVVGLLDRSQSAHALPTMHKDDLRHPAQKPSLIEEEIQSLKREDEMLNNILAVDVWALAKTMDEFQPGFWAAFMKNREQALKRFLEEMIKAKPRDNKRPPFL